MKAAIIAAGLGERLQHAGITQPKPLVPVAGKPLIDYALAGIVAAGLHEVACIVNEASAGVEDHCHRAWPDLRFEFVRRTTPSSMESLFTLSPLLTDGRFVLLTVDAVCAPATLGAFIAAAGARTETSGVLAVSTYVDDEKPLWLQLAADGRITALGATAEGSGLVTAGFYVFDPSIFAEMPAARAARYGALRQFLAHLLSRGYRLDGVHVAKTVDVDRAEDLSAAEAFVRSGFAA